MKRVGIGIIIGIVISISMVVLAKTGTVDLPAMYSDIEIKINGKVIQLKDTNGNNVEPFIINGTTYVPVRAVSEALGQTVVWEPNTQTVRIYSSSLGGDPYGEALEKIKQKFNELMDEDPNIEDYEITEFSYWGYDMNFMYCFYVIYNVKPSEGLFDQMANLEENIAVIGTADEESGWITQRSQFFHVLAKDGRIYDYHVSNSPESMGGSQ